MTAFLILITIGLLGITIWQISKIFQLSKTKKSDTPPGIQDDKDNKTQGYLMLIFGVLFYAFMIYNLWVFGQYLPPKSGTAEGVELDRLMLITNIVILVVQAIMQALIFYFGYKYHGKKGQRALFNPENEKLEFAWTIIPVITLAILIVYGLFTWSDIMNVSKDDGDIMVIELYAYQFGWKVRYSGKDNTLGKANVRYIKGVNTLGVDVSDPYSQDDIVSSVMHLPVGKKVLIKMRSQDVIHSAYFPLFRAQMNVVPGMITQFAFTPTVTTKEMRKTPYMIEKVKNINEIRREKSQKLAAKGDLPLKPYTFDYFLLCNKVCGTSHYNMQMKVIVESQKDFEKWLSEQKDIGETIKNS